MKFPEITVSAAKMSRSSSKRSFRAFHTMIKESNKKVQLTDVSKLFIRFLKTKLFSFTNVIWMIILFFVFILSIFNLF